MKEDPEHKYPCGWIPDKNVCKWCMHFHCPKNTNYASRPVATTEAPKVHCPVLDEEVPIWYCLGSLTQGLEKCEYLISATVHGGESAEVECKINQVISKKELK